MDNDKSAKKRSYFDRRSGEDRRSTYNIDYFLEGGTERRNNPTRGRRRKEKDRRKDWIKISQWSSLNIADEEINPGNEEEPEDTE